MARVHFWQFLVNEEGQPIENADISVYLSSSVSAANVYDREYGGTPITTVPQTTTDTNGYFEFWIADSDDTTYGYANDTKFKLTWDKTGVAAGSINYVDILPNVNVGFPVDETDTNSTKDKFVSNRLAKGWEDHKNYNLTTVDISGNQIYPPGPNAHGIVRMIKGQADELENKLIANADSYRWDSHREWYFSAISSAAGPHGIEPFDPSDTGNNTFNRLVSNQVLYEISAAAYAQETLESFYDNGTTSGAIKIDLDNGKNQAVAINGDSTIIFTNWSTNSNVVHPLTLEILSGGAHTVSFSSSGWVSGSFYQVGNIVASNGVSAAISLTSAGNYDIVEFYTRDKGHTVRAFQSGENMI